MLQPLDNGPACRRENTLNVSRNEFVEQMSWETKKSTSTTKDDG